MENTERLHTYSPEQEAMNSVENTENYSYAILPENNSQAQDYSQYQGESNGNTSFQSNTTDEFISMGDGIIYNPNYKGKNAKAKNTKPVQSDAINRKEQEAYNRGMRDILHSIGIEFKSVQEAIATADKNMSDEQLMEEIGYMIKDFLRINMFANETTMNIDNYVRKGGDPFHYIQSLQPIDYKSMTDRDIYITYMRSTGVKDNFISDQLDDMTENTLKKSAKQMRMELIAAQPNEESLYAEQQKYNEDMEKHFATIEENLYYVAKNNIKHLVGIDNDTDIANLIEYVIPKRNDEGVYMSDIELDLFSGIGNPDMAKASDYMPLLLAANELLNGKRNKQILLDVGKQLLFDKINMPLKQKNNTPQLDNETTKRTGSGLEFIR